MKKLQKIIGLSVGALMISTAFAQAPTSIIQPVLNNTATMPDPSATTKVDNSSHATLAGSDAMRPPTGNVYEREVTPLLREISRKKAVLELRRLDSEIEKIDADMLKSQQEKQNGNLINAQDIRNGAFNAMNQANYNNLAQAQAPVSQDIRVLMTYGYEDNLYAKILNGEQGGYVIKKGDILPDGRQVVSVQTNYIEVKAGSKTKSGLKKIYVTGPLPLDANGKPILPLNNNSGNSGANNGGSSNVSPPTLLGPLAAPSFTSVPAMQIAPPAAPSTN